MRTGNVFTFGASVSFTCNIGYVLLGSSDLTCESNGRWSNAVPTCMLLDCGDPGTALNSDRRMLGTTVNHRVNYTCNPGYNLVGSSFRVCTVNDARTAASWSNSLPACVRKNRVFVLCLEELWCNRLRFLIHVFPLEFTPQVYFWLALSLQVIDLLLSFCSSQIYLLNWSSIFGYVFVSSCQLPWPWYPRRWFKRQRRSCFLIWQRSQLWLQCWLRYARQCKCTLHGQHAMEFSTAHVSE